MLLHANGTNWVNISGHQSLIVSGRVLKQCYLHNNMDADCKWIYYCYLLMWSLLIIVNAFCYIVQQGTASMYQVGATSLRPWQVLHGDNKRKQYWWLTRQSADRSSTIPTCLESKPTWHQLQKIQYTQKEALRIVTGCHKMSSINHLHTEAEN